MDGQHLHILWTDADPVIFDKMVLVYVVNSLVWGWQEEVVVVLWREITHLAVADPTVKEHIVLATEQRARFPVYITCTRELGVGQALRDMGLEATSWDPPLAELLKAQAPLLTVWRERKRG